VPETDECRPDCAYQARRQREEEEEHRQKSIPDDLELPCPDCRRWFDEGKERCKSCDYKFDGEEEDDDDEKFECCGCGKWDLRDWMLNTRYDDYYCEKCWENVPKELHPYIEGLDDEDELCSAIDASGNALY